MAYKEPSWLNQSTMYTKRRA